MRIYKIFGYFVVLNLVILFSCSKDDLKTNREKIIGKWISESKSDTLDFIDSQNFYKSSNTMSYDHFDYQLLKDSIEVRYSGKCFVQVYPTLHKYSIDDNKLIINFSNNQCYGFVKENITLIKEQK